MVSFADPSETLRFPAATAGTCSDEWAGSIVRLTPGTACTFTAEELRLPNYIPKESDLSQPKLFAVPPSLISYFAGINEFLGSGHIE